MYLHFAFGIFKIFTIKVVAEFKLTSHAQEKKTSIIVTPPPTHTHTQSINQSCNITANTDKGSYSCFNLEAFIW